MKTKRRKMCVFFVGKLHVKNLLWLDVDTDPNIIKGRELQKIIKTDENPYPQSTMNIQAEEKSSHKISFDGSIKNGH